MNASTLRLALCVPAMLLLAACASEDPAVAHHDDNIGTEADAISATDVISRAMEWVDAKLLYCQSANHKPDYDSACPSTCSRTNNAAWDPYRSDCSGLISWAWGLPAPGRVTSEFAPYNTAVSHEISPDDLAPGDALNSTPDEHIIMFKAWTKKGSEATFIEEPGCSVSPNYAHEFTSGVTINSNGTIHVSYEGMTFYAIRFNSISAQSPDWAAAYVSQTWPLASGAAIDLTVGETKKGSIDLKNTGGKTWPKGVVKLAPIPRDKASKLAAGSWLSSTRVSSVTSDVKPGDVGHFEWDLEGSEPGDSKPFFGLVAEGIAWFADSGGPPDNDLQVNVHVVAAPPATTGTGGMTGSAGHEASAGKGGETSKGGEGGETSKGGEGGETSKGGEGGETSKGGEGGETSKGGEGGTSSEAGHTGQGGTPGSAGTTTSSAGTKSTPSTGGATGTGGAAGSDADGSMVLSLDDTSPTQSGGCAVTPTTPTSTPTFLLALAALAAATTRRKHQKAA